MICSLPISLLGLLALSQGALIQAARVNPADGLILSKADVPEPPVFPDTYTLEFNISMPHFFLTQPDGLSIPYKIWFDGEKGRKRVEVFGGMNVLYEVNGQEYTVYPKGDVLDCGSWLPGPVREGTVQGGKAPSFLPSLEGWMYGGDAEINGKEALIWEYQLKEGDKVSQYAFYTDKDSGAPLKLHMMGINYLTNSHYDEYVYDFFSFTTKMKLKDEDFTPPAICDDVSKILSGRDPRAYQILSLMPSLHAPRDATLAPYVAWAAQNDREVRSEAELRTRANLFAATAARIAAHNADSTKTWKAKLNKFADWTEEEFVNIMLPNRLNKDRREKVQAIKDSYTPIGKFERKIKRKDLPKEVDWRGTGADPGVKDQGMCGSCFAFAATGSMDGVWYVSTGQHRSFSEQQIIDCAWNYGPNGCGGGDFQPVFNYIAEAGGIALEQDYQYLSTNDYCREKEHDRPGKFAGFLEIEERDEAAVMEAVYRLGPLAVGVDASDESFRYYSEGIYKPDNCATASRDLDHAVVLFGYGTSDEGEDYWLVRNSWAKYYGDDGYIKIARGKHDCGISTDATVAVVADDYLAPGADMRSLSAVRKWN